MNPFLFGSAHRQLFGLYHPASGRRKRQGVLICAPLGREYLWAHRGCRHLAEKLAASGFDVLRFDYFGTGDSAGEGWDVSLAGCAEDTLTALSEIRALGDVREVALVGLRIGGAIGLSAASLDQGVRRLVLWDPVLHGPDYLRELLGGKGETPTEEGFAGGFPLPPELRAELSRLTAATLPVAFKEGLLIVSEDLSRHRELLESLEGDVLVDFEVKPASPVWLEESDLGVGAVPVAILERIGTWLRGEAPVGSA